jgi:hypothetical protein
MYTEENMERILSYFLSNKMQSNYVLEKNMLNDLPGIDKQDFTDCIDVMEGRGMISVTRSSESSDGISSVFVRPLGLYYFTEKEKAREKERKNDRRWIVTTTISVIALVIAALSVAIALKSLMIQSPL